MAGLSHLIEAIDCMGNTHTPLSLNLPSSIVLGMTHALLALPLLLPADDAVLGEEEEEESFEAFRAADGQSRFVRACAALLDHINKTLIPTSRPSWISCDEILFLLQVCVFLLLCISII